MNGLMRLNPKIIQICAMVGFYMFIMWCQSDKQCRKIISDIGVMSICNKLVAITIGEQPARQEIAITKVATQN